MISSTGEERVGTPITKINLPILPNIEESNGVEWGKDKMNIIQNTLVKSQVDTMSSDGMGDVLGNLLSGTGDLSNKSWNNLD